ncbi:hypothetical protein J3A84_11875 [Proteiniclasticum sp. SCR006]|uniref:Lipocalin-like domain-containing protein n=1 Tax=Proteiniclasticum aestuarii TaxID=2817862 RepID=A0A939HC45_9CLOT|nr:hypothetical protein [Proteiniclasticum aestuarii]MBO1265728.1 hypothetical protein [Proteiniclasticum aestuarii]
MNDRELKKLEGRWFLQYSGCPLWQKGSIDTISFNYELMHKGENLVLKEKVEFRKNGKMKIKRGFEIPMEGSNVLNWKGIGMNKFFRNQSKVLYNKEGILIMWFEKTISTPESIDVLTRKKHLSAEESVYIFSILENLKETSGYVGELESVNIL